MTGDRPSIAPAVLAVGAFVAHLAVVAWGPYGPHRDALLYYAMGEHLSLFAMDFPPFIALVARAFRAFGDAEVLLHVPVAAAHAALILLAGAFARRARGGPGAQALAALAVATAPVFLRAGSLFQPVVFDQLWWTAALWALAGLGTAAGIGTTVGIGPAAGIRTAVGLGTAARPRRRWLLLGAVLGLGLLTKFTILVLGAGLLVAILATPLRRWLLTPWPWLAATLALVIGSPSLIGQFVLDWPFLGQFQDLQSVQLGRITPAAFVLEQLLMVGPVVVLAAGVSLALMVRGGDAGRRDGDTGLRDVDPGLRRDAAGLRDGDTGLRAVAWAAAASFALMLVAGGKPYYIAPIWPALLGIALGRTDAWVRRHRERAAAAEAVRGRAAPAAGGRAAATGARRGRATPAAARTRVAGGVVWLVLWLAVAGYGVATLPLGLPFLPPEPMARYAASLGVTQAVTTNTGERLELPQDYADMLGWDALARTVEAVWRGLPARDRERAVIIATNYGRAGAIDYFASDDLPDVLAPVGSYWFWGPGDLPGDVAVVVGAEVDALAGHWRSVVEVTRARRPWGVPEERDVPIVVARDPVRPLQEVWPEFRGVN